MDNPLVQVDPGLFIWTIVIFLVLLTLLGNAQAQTVQTCDWIGSDWAIVSGLKTGDLVIVDNLLKVRPGVPVVEAPAAAAPAATGTPAAAPAK